jgi:hypothetical protein
MIWAILKLLRQDFMNRLIYPFSYSPPAGGGEYIKQTVRAFWRLEQMLHDLWKVGILSGGYRKDDRESGSFSHFTFY